MDIMKASQVTKAIETNGFEFGVSADTTVVTHSRGTTWVCQSPTGAYLNIQLTEGGEHIMAVLPSKFGGQKAPKATAPAFEFGYIKIGRNTIEARRYEDGTIIRRDRSGCMVPYTGTAKFQLA